MIYKNYKKALADSKNIIISKFGKIPNESGIYIFARSENGIKFAYVGQAKHLFTRIAEHLQGFQHIDLSIKKHGLFSLDNVTGYNLTWFSVPEDRLDDEERYYIKLYANAGYQMRNHTVGGQDKGKFGLGETKPSKTYRDGLKQGEINALRRIKELFDKYLDFQVKEPCNKVKERKKEEFEKILFEVQ